MVGRRGFDPESRPEGPPLADGRSLTADSLFGTGYDGVGLQSLPDLVECFSIFIGNQRPRAVKNWRQPSRPSKWPVTIQCMRPAFIVVTGTARAKKPTFAPTQLERGWGIVFPVSRVATPTEANS